MVCCVRKPAYAEGSHAHLRLAGSLEALAGWLDQGSPAGWLTRRLADPQAGPNSADQQARLRPDSQRGAGVLEQQLLPGAGLHGVPAMHESVVWIDTSTEQLHKSACSIQQSCESRS